MSEKTLGCSPRILRWEAEVPVPPLPDTNFPSFFLNVLAQYGEEKALVDAATGKYHTYGDIRRLALRLQGGLLAAGVCLGDAVMLLTPNHIDAPIVLLSVMLSGAICVPVSPLLTPEELAHIAKISGARWVISHEEAVERAEVAFAHLGHDVLKHLWVIGDTPGRSSLADLLRTEPSRSTSIEEFDSSNTVAMMPFSSGTTSFPKGVMLSHKNLMTQYMQYKYLREMKPPGSLDVMQTTLLVLPIYHSYGYTILMNCLSSGGTIIMLQKFTPERFLEAIQNYKVTYCPIVPHTAKFLTETHLLQKYDQSSLMAFNIGGSPLPYSTRMALVKKYGKEATQGYGMTETCAPAAVNGGPFGFKVASAGKILPYFECKIVDVRTGEAVGEGVEGEVCLRGPAIMLGYFNNPKATSETIDPEGWLHTGDLGYYDEDNFIFVTDRIKDLIKVKGFQVCPSELEELLMGLEGVSEVAVVGVPDDRLGEAPRAYVVPVQGVILDPQVIIKHVADHVISYKQLTGGVEFVEFLPKNHLGKVLKRSLKDKFNKVKSNL